MDLSKDQFSLLAGKLLKYMMTRLKIKSPPSKLVLKESVENSKKPWGYTGNYNPEDKSITLFITDRHHIDILRTFAHEVIHHWQNETGNLIEKTNKPQDNQYAQKDPHMRQMEKQAYLLGNIIFRDFEDIERFGHTDIVNESELSTSDDKIGYKDDKWYQEWEQRNKAEKYFSIGQDDEESKNNFCWAWLDGRLQYKKGGSHGINFGHDRTDKTYKGWYDTYSKILSFVFPNGEGKTVDDIPQNVYTSLKNKFHPQKIEVF